MHKYTFKDHFRINKRDFVEFANIPLDGDLLAFICPFLIANNKDDEDIADKIYLQLEDFFINLNKNYIVPNDRKNGLIFLSELHEPNEYHFGYSGTNKGKAIASEKAEIIYDSLRRNKLAKQGITISNEAHNILLLVEGIGQDLMSDTISNVCRNIFAEFTENQCAKYKIQTFKTKVKYYNSVTGKWDTKEFNLPQYKGKRLILVPKFIVSGGRAYSTRYNYFISSNFISKDIMSNKVKVKNNKMVSILKDGTKKCIIKEIHKAYGKPKSGLVDFVLQYQGSLQDFLDYCKLHYPAIDLDNIKED
ncbi:hypothetical protein [Flavobacterium psychrophilum]|uniref:hypothetical protein n=1 Tax=Flavobacterium psychrophilum TaxID=96345 RepID=UPI00106A14E2|nr:hypothetical protein [Flavobacterium psychrophilum]